jgi:preprotein translocase subunit SecG
MKWAELLVPFFNVIYVVIAFVMIVLILMQRGAGAQAGSSFGAGASGTVFGSQGSANFLSRATAVCATLFFLISIGMGIYISHGGRAKPTAGGLMSEFATPAAAKTPASELPVAPTAVPSPGAVAPAAPNLVTPPSATVPAPAAPAIVVPTPVAPTPAEAVPAPTGQQPN